MSSASLTVEKLKGKEERRHEDEKASFGEGLAKCSGVAWRGLGRLISEVMALEEGACSVFFEAGLSAALLLPLTVLCTWCTVTLEYSFGWDIYQYISFLLAFLLIFRLQTSFARYWEARTLLAEAKTSIISLGLIAVTQYHRHYGDPSDEVKLCLEDVHRYLCLFYFTLANSLRDKDLRQRNIERFVTEDELKLLRKGRGVEAPVVVIKWIGSRLTSLEAMGYISPLQLHETNEGLEGMVEAFNGLDKIKTTKIPSAIRQFCTFLTLFFVYTSPFAIATGFTQVYTSFNNILARALLSAFISGVFYLSINATSRTLEDPIGDDPHDLDLDDIGHELVLELAGMFSDPIPCVVGVNEEVTKEGFQGKPMKATPDQGSRGGHMKSADGKPVLKQRGSEQGVSAKSFTLIASRRGA